MINAHKDNCNFNLDLYIDFYCHKHILAKGSRKQIQDHLIWFIGFSEGNGSWTADPSKNKFRFSIGQKDKPLLDKIKNDILGFGEIYRNRPNIYQFNVFRRTDIKALIALFNGNLVLLKVQQRFFGQWIQKMSSDFFPPNFIYNNNRHLPSLNNSWLSGFISAEGCFYTGFENQKDMLLPYCRQTFEIGQVDVTNGSEREVIVLIGQMFNKSGIKTRKKRKNIFYTTVINKALDLSILRNYLNNFPIKGKKQNCFLLWCMLLDLRLKNQIYKQYEKTEALVKQIKEINNEIQKTDLEPIKSE